MLDTLEFFLLETPAGKWLSVLLTAAGLTFVLKAVLGFISRRLRRLSARTASKWDDVGIDLIDGLRKWVIFIVLTFVIERAVAPTDEVNQALLIVLVSACTYQVGLWGLHLIRMWHATFLEERIVRDPSSAAALSLLATTVQMAFLLVLALIALSNVGVNISALLAGVGVGGIAIALAAQNILGDLFASLSIVFDKPFIVGDFIVAGNQMGIVERIGIKTTRLRALSGEELVLSNKDLLESRIQNYKSLWERRVVQTFSLAHDTPAEKLALVPGWVKEIVEAREKVRFDRCHFFRFGASSRDFELVFYVKDPAYGYFMERQQEILLEMMAKFAREKVLFALPVQAVQLERALPGEQDANPSMSLNN